MNILCPFRLSVSGYGTSKLIAVSSFKNMCSILTLDRAVNEEMHSYK